MLGSRRLGGAWTLDRIWERLGIGAAIRTAASGRRLDAAVIERVIFALVAQRALEPGSKLAVSLVIPSGFSSNHLLDSWTSSVHGRETPSPQ